MPSRWFIIAISIFTVGYNFVKFFELTVKKVNFLDKFFKKRKFCPKETLHGQGNRTLGMNETNSKSNLVKFFWPVNLEKDLTANLL